jgi:undecaprenyl-diphosphatase
MSGGATATLALVELEGRELAFGWTLVWLAATALLLVLAILAFGYLLARRRWDELSRLLRHPALAAVDRRLSERVPWLWRHIRRRFTVRQWHGLALTVAGVVSFAALYLFALVTEGWTEEEELYALDQLVYGWLVESMNQPVTAFMQRITHLGDGLTVAVLGLVLAVFLLVRRDRRELTALALSVGVGSAMMWGLKWLFERARPGEQLADALGHSFPSGHAFLAMTLYGFVIYLTWRLVRRDAVRIAVTVALTLVVFLVALSRVILRVHWVSDVAGGLTVGLAWLVCSLVLSRALEAWLASRRA